MGLNEIKNRDRGGCKRDKSISLFSFCLHFWQLHVLLSFAMLGKHNAKYGDCYIGWQACLFVSQKWPMHVGHCFTALLISESVILAMIFSSVYYPEYLQNM
jgi:hypothetical protein